MGKIIAAGNRWAFGGFLNYHGQLLGSFPTQPANGAASPMFQIDGIKTVPLEIPDRESVGISGDDISLGDFDFDSLTTRMHTIEYAVYDMDRDATLTGVKKTMIGGIETIPSDIAQSPEYNVTTIYQGRAKNYPSGSAAWDCVMLNMATMNPLGRNGFNERGAASYRAAVSPQLSQYKPGGVTYSEADDGTLAARRHQFKAPFPIHRVAFVGDGSATAIPVPYTPASVSLVGIFVNRVLLGAPASISANSVTPPSSITEGALGEVIYCFIP